MPIHVNEPHPNKLYSTRREGENPQSKSSESPPLDNSWMKRVTKTFFNAPESKSKPTSPEESNAGPSGVVSVTCSAIPKSPSGQTINSIDSGNFSKTQLEFNNTSTDELAIPETLECHNYEYDDSCIGERWRKYFEAKRKPPTKRMSI